MKIRTPPPELRGTCSVCGAGGLPPARRGSGKQSNKVTDCNRLSTWIKTPKSAPLESPRSYVFQKICSCPSTLQGVREEWSTLVDSGNSVWPRPQIETVFCPKFLGNSQTVTVPGPARWPDRQAARSVAKRSHNDARSGARGEHGTKKKRPNGAIL